MKNTETPKIAL